MTKNVQFQTFTRDDRLLQLYIEDNKVFIVELHRRTLQTIDILHKFSSMDIAIDYWDTLTR